MPAGREHRLVIVVQLRKAAAATFHPGGDAAQRAGVPDNGLRTLEQVLDRLDIELTPMHPGVGDPDLRTYFTVSRAPEDGARCEEIAAALRREAAVTAAYVKPAEAPAAP